MKLFSKAADGGEGSGVTGFFLVEIKPLFSIVLLRFNKGTREAFHEHAFNAWTLWLKGSVWEWKRSPPPGRRIWRQHFSAGRLKYTPRSCLHKIDAVETTWALSVRGPWVDRWRELRGDKFITLTHGRKEIAE